jgi:tetratricopeptide (TPR) repeat protein
MAAQSDANGALADTAAALIDLGDVLAERSDFYRALKNYSEAIEIIERLLDAYPAAVGLAHALAVTLNKSGRAQLAQDDVAGALTSYHKSLGIFERLEMADPGDTRRQRDLAVAFSSLGDVRAAYGDVAGALPCHRSAVLIMERLAKSDPGDVATPIHLAAALDKLGDVHRAQGDLSSALNSYRQSAAILGRLERISGSERVPALPVSLNKVGEVQMALGDLDGALSTYQQSLTVAEKRGSELDLLEVHGRMIELFERQGKFEKAASSSSAALQIARRIDESREAVGGDDRSRAAVLARPSLGSLAHSLESRRCKRAPQTAARADTVEFGVSFPPAIDLRQSLIIEAWIFQRGSRPAVIERVKQEKPRQDFQSGGSGSVARGTPITVRLKIPYCRLEPATHKVSWDGEITNVSFVVSPFGEFAGHGIIGSCIFWANGCRIGQVAFEVGLRGDGAAEFVGAATVKQAFASYAHEDWREVLARVAGIEKVGVKVFLDSHDIRSNEKWRDRIHQEIDDSDVLYLFWSRHAKESKEVEHEWRYGLQRRGEDFIDPVPLVDPREVPPPPELAQKHFHDWTLIHMGYEDSVRGSKGSE